MASYKNCRHNHAASLGTYAYDGCPEFLPDESVDAKLFRCAVCGCHRGFHRKVTEVAAFPVLPAQERPKRRRPRTKFTAEQKNRMAEFSEKIGWRLPGMHAGHNDEVASFCKEIGVSRRVFRSWMHNHKNGSASADAAGDGDGDETASPLKTN